MLAPTVRVQQSGKESMPASTWPLPGCLGSPLAGAAAAGEGMGWSVSAPLHPAAGLLSGTAR